MLLTTAFNSAHFELAILYEMPPSEALYTKFTLFGLCQSLLGARLCCSAFERRMALTTETALLWPFPHLPCVVRRLIRLITPPPVVVTFITVEEVAADGSLVSTVVEKLEAVFLWLPLLFR